MKKHLPLLLGMLWSISAIGQVQELKKQDIPSYKKFIDQTMMSKLYEDLKTDSIINESWNSSDSTYTNSNRDVVEYSNGKSARLIHANWDNVAGEWALSYKTEYSYDGNGFRTMEMGYNWDASASQWKQAWKSVENPDQNGNDTLSFSYNWDVNENDWVLGMRYTYHFDNEGNETYFLMCQWNAEHSTWDSVMKSDFYLDENGVDTVDISSSWDSNTSHWNATSKSRSFLDENGLDTLTCQYQWSSESNEWIIGQRGVSEYTSEGMDSVVSVYGWNVIDSVWNGFFRFEMQYDEDRSYVNQFMWNEGEWQFFSRITTYYSAYLPTGISNTIQEGGIYPNPASDFIVIDIPGVSEDAYIQLFSVQGRKVLSQKITYGKQVSTSNLPNGLYLYKIINNGKEFTGKLVIQ
jgi:hypothetical protein